MVISDGKKILGRGDNKCKILLQKMFGMFKEQLGGQWGQSGMRGKIIGDEVREIWGSRPYRALSVRLQ